MFAGPWHVLYSGGNARYCEMVKLCTTPCFSTLFVQTLGSLGKIYSGRVLILRRKMKSSTLHLEGIFWLEPLRDVNMVHPGNDSLIGDLALEHSFI